MGKIKNKFTILTISLGILLMLGGTAYANLDSGLVAYYPFSGNANAGSGDKADDRDLDKANMSESQYSLSGTFIGTFSGSVSDAFSGKQGYLTLTITSAATVVAGYKLGGTVTLTGFSSCFTQGSFSEGVLMEASYSGFLLAKGAGFSEAYLSIDVSRDLTQILIKPSSSFFKDSGGDFCLMLSSATLTKQGGTTTTTTTTSTTTSTTSSSSTTTTPTTSISTTTTILPTRPTVTTGSATLITSNSAILNGKVNPNGSSTEAYFEYGTTMSYGSATASEDIGSGSSSVTVNATISDLISDTTYHYRLTAMNSAGTSSGADKIFYTAVVYVSSDGTCGGNTPCYFTIQEAIDAAESGTVIKILQGTYDEDLILSSSKDLTLSGGWDSTFTTQSLNTTVNSITISDGTVTVDNLVIIVF